MIATTNVLTMKNQQAAFGSFRTRPVSFGCNRRSGAKVSVGPAPTGLTTTTPPHHHHWHSCGLALRPACPDGSHDLVRVACQSPLPSGQAGQRAYNSLSFPVSCSQPVADPVGASPTEIQRSSCEHGSIEVPERRLHPFHLRRPFEQRQQKEEVEHGSALIRIRGMWRH